MVIPLATSLGVSQEELFASFAALTKVIPTTAEVGTTMRGILTSMVKPTNEMEVAIAQLGKQYGFTGAEAMVAQLGMKGSLDALIATTDGSQESITKLFGRVEALTGAMLLTGASSETVTKNMAAMEIGAGEMRVALDEQTEGINKAGFAWDQFKAQVEVAAQKLGDELIPIVMDAVEELKPLGGWLLKLIAGFGDLPGPVKTVVVAFGGLIAVAGPLLILLGSLVSSIGALLPAITAVGGALSGVLAPALAVVATAIAAYKLTEWYMEWTGIRDIVDKVVQALWKWKDPASSVSTQMGALEKASAIAGRTITDLSEAVEILTEHNTKLREEIEPTVEKVEKLSDKGKELNSVFAGTLIPTFQSFGAEVLYAKNQALMPTAEYIKTTMTPVMEKWAGVVLNTTPHVVVYGEETVVATDLTAKFTESLQAAANMTIVFGRTIGSVFGGAASAISGFGKLFSKEGGGFGLGAFTEMFKATEGANRGKMTFGSILGGLASALPAIGALAGPIISGISALFKLGGPDIARDVSRDLGPHISQGLADAIEQSGQPVQLAIADVFREGFANGSATVDMLAQEMGDLFSFFERGEISQPQLITALEASIPMLIQHFQELGPAGEEQLQRIIAAAERLGIEFEGLDELIQGTFAPDTMEDIASAFDMTNEQVRELAEQLGVNVQTNLERMAATAGLSVDEFKELAAIVKDQFGLSMEQIDALAKSLGVTVEELAESLGVDVKDGAEDTEDAFKQNAEYMKNSADEAIRLAEALERAARAAGDINIPSAPSAGFANETPFGGALFTRPSMISVAETQPERVWVQHESKAKGPGGGGGINYADHSTYNVYNASDPEGFVKYVVANKDQAMTQIFERAKQKGLM